MAVRNQIEAFRLKRQVTSRLITGLKVVVRCSFDLDDINSEWPKPLSRDGHVWRPSLGGDRMRRVNWKIGQPLASAGPHVEHVVY